MGSVEEVSRLLIEWEEADSAGRDVTPILTKYKIYILQMCSV